MASKVIDLKKRISRNKRKVKRTVLKDLIGASVVVPRRGLVKVAIYDISEGGLAFDMDRDHGQFQEGEMVGVRLYLSHTTYFPFSVEVSYVRLVEEEGTFRHGVSFAKGFQNEEALRHLVKFMESVSMFLEADTGDMMASSQS